MKSKADQSQGMLLFTLSRNQLFAIGTLKIREIVPSLHLTKLPGAHSCIMGTASFRNLAIPVIDMGRAVGYPKIPESEYQNCSVIVTDCQRKVVGFAVRTIEKIGECNWREITPPPSTLGTKAFLTGIMRMEEKLVQLLDVEFVISKVFPLELDKRHPIISDIDREKLKPMRILLIDDSMIARKQLSDALDCINIPYDVASNGLDALDMLKAAASNNAPYDIVVSDIEMPGIDGYELAFEIRSNDSLSEAYLILHTSLSSAISVDRAKQVGAHEALTKFDAGELVNAMLRGAEQKIQGVPIKLEGGIQD